MNNFDFDLCEKPKTLKLVLTYKWFDKIKAGEKTKEFREVKPHWNKKFGRTLAKPYDKVEFQRAYSKNAEKILFKIKKIYQSTEKNDLNAPLTWVIELGDRIQVNE